MVAPIPKSPAPERVVLHGVSWDLYQRIRDGVADRKRMTYDDGTLEIMSPLFIHERIKTLLGAIVERTALQLGLDLERAGSTTFASEVLKKGLEPDECFYIAHAATVRGLERIELDECPPPDLAIEVDITSPSVPRLPIYAAMGVPEVWRFDGSELHTMCLHDRGNYESIAQSRALPGITPSDFHRFLLQSARGEAYPRLIAEVETWLRERYPK